MNHSNSNLIADGGGGVEARPSKLVFGSFWLTVLYLVAWFVTYFEANLREQLPNWCYWGVFGCGFGVSLGWLIWAFVPVKRFPPLKYGIASVAFCLMFKFVLFIASSEGWGFTSTLADWRKGGLYVIGLAWVVWSLEVLWRKYEQLRRGEFGDLSAELARLIKLSLIFFPIVPLWARKKQLPIRVTALVFCLVGYSVVLGCVLVPAYILTSMHFNLDSFDGEVEYLPPDTNVVLCVRPASAWQTKAFAETKEDPKLERQFHDWMDLYGLSSVAKFEDIERVVIGIPGDTLDASRSLMVVRFRRPVGEPDNPEVFGGPVRDVEADAINADITKALQKVKADKAAEEGADSNSPAPPDLGLPTNDDGVDKKTEVELPDTLAKTDKPTGLEKLTAEPSEKTDGSKTDGSKTADTKTADSKTDERKTDSAKSDSTGEAPADTKSNEQPEAEVESKLTFEVVEYKGKSYYRPTDEERKSVFFQPTKDVLVAGSEEAVKHAIDRGATTELNWFKSVGTRHHVILAASNLVAQQMVTRNQPDEAKTESIPDGTIQGSDGTSKTQAVDGKSPASKKTPVVSPKTTAKTGAKSQSKSLSSAGVKPNKKPASDAPASSKSVATADPATGEPKPPEEPSPLLDHLTAFARAYRFGDDAIRQSVSTIYENEEQAVTVEQFLAERLAANQEAFRTQLKELETKNEVQLDEEARQYIERTARATVTRAGNIVESGISLATLSGAIASNDVDRIARSIPDGEFLHNFLRDAMTPAMTNVVPGESGFRMGQDGWPLYASVLEEDVINGWTVFLIVLVAFGLVLLTWLAWLTERWLAYRRSLAGTDGSDAEWWSGPASTSRYIWNPCDPEAWFYGRRGKKLNQTFAAFVAYSLLFFLVVWILANLRGCEEHLDSPAGGGEAKIMQKVQVQKIQKIKYIINPFSIFEIKIPDIDDVKVIDEEDTAHLYTVGFGKGKGAGFAGGTDRGMVRFIRLEYDGGDWNQDMGVGADLNMLVEYRVRTSQKIHNRTESRRLSDLHRFTRMGAPPFVFLTGQGTISASNREVKALREYLMDKHGMVFCDNGGSQRFEGAFVALMRRAVPEAVMVPIPADAQIHRQPYKIPHPIPLVSLHGSTRRALGWRFDGRWIAYYHPGDIADAWKDGYTDKIVKEVSFRLGTNIIFYAYAEHAKWKTAQSKNR